MTTDLVELKMDYPLAATVHLKNMSESELMVIGKAFPEESLTDEQRMNKAVTMRAQFMLYIETIDNSKNARDKVLQCVTQSIAECMLTLASLDLPMVRSLKYAALIPYSNVCTVSIMYQGLCELIYRTGSVASISCGVVYKGDQFAYEVGTNPALRCIRGTEPATEDNVTHAWALAHNVKGPDTIEVMELPDLQRIKNASKMSKGPAWRNWWGQMYRKAPIRRMANYLRMGAGAAQTVLARALDLENSEFRLEQLDKYRDMRKTHSRELIDAAFSDGDGPKTLPAPKNNDDLRRAVSEMRESTESSLSDDGFIRAVIVDVLKKKTMQPGEEFDKVWNAIVVEKNYDLATAERIPDIEEKQE